MQSEMKVLTDSPSDESTNGKVMTPAATGVSDIEPVVSSTLASVQPVESNSQMANVRYMETQLTCDAESTKPPDQETSRSTGHFNPGRTWDAAEMDTTVTAVRPKCRSLWSRVKRFTRRMFCCSDIDIKR